MIVVTDGGRRQVTEEVSNNELISIIALISIILDLTCFVCSKVLRPLF